jgi:hypothetical protein
MLDGDRASAHVHRVNLSNIRGGLADHVDPLPQGFRFPAQLDRKRKPFGVLSGARDREIELPGVQTGSC